MTKFQTLALTAAVSLFTASGAMADSMSSHATMKADAAQMKKCKAMGEMKAKADAKCVALMKKADAMKGDAMKGDAMKGDAMSSDHH